MSLTKEKKADIIKTYGNSPKDVGSYEVQIALLTEKIAVLSVHIQANKKDAHNRKGLLSFIAKRKKFLKVLQEEDFNRYKTIITKLNLRK